jgi:hypothetical protein
MNLISWENGDSTITDYPDCADRVLARIVQQVNDNICDHRDGDLLCPPCSLEVLALGHRTVGTGTIPLSELERRQVWAAIAADQARAVLHLVPAARKGVAIHAIEAAEKWATDPSETNRLNAASAAASAYSSDSAASSAYAASAYAAYSSAYSSASAASSAYAAYASASAADSAVEKSEQLRLAHRAIDLFEKLTEGKRTERSEVTAEQVEQAYACMTSQ